MPIARQLKNRVRGAVGRLRRDRPGLLTYLFHGAFADEAQIELGHMHPQQRVTVEHFQRFAEHYLAAGYRFISPDDLGAGLDPGGRHVMATFDDGYQNNRLVLPVLQKLDIPAVFFVSTGHIKTGRNFWWDPLYRARDTDAGQALNARRHELKRMTAPEVERILRAELGEDCLRPVSEVDRPMTRDELAAFASDPHVHLGNHTVDHAILTAYDAAGIRDQIVGCQNDLQQMAGVRPTIISYPNGDHDERVLTASREAGLRWGITVTKRKNYPPFGSGPNDPLRLGRYTLWGDQDVDQQCRRHRSDLSLEGLGLKRPPGAPVSSVDGSRS